MLSKAFSKSTKSMSSCLCYSVHCSMMLRNVKIWSVHPLSFLMPACFFLMPASTEPEIRFMMILARILLGTDSRAMLCQLLQSLSAPFSGILMTTLFVQSAGTSSPSHTAAKSGRRMVAVSCGSVLKSSVLRLPCPGALPFLRDLIALIISSFGGTTLLMSRSSTASGMSTSCTGGGLFRISLKCSVQCFSLCLSPPLSRQKGSLLVFDDGICMGLVLSREKKGFLRRHQTLHIQQFMGASLYMYSARCSKI